MCADWVPTQLSGFWVLAVDHVLHCLRPGRLAQQVRLQAGQLIIHQGAHQSAARADAAQRAPICQETCSLVSGWSQRPDQL